MRSNVDRDPQYFLKSVTEFTETLAHAIYDRNLENTSDRKPVIRYYYDADVVVRMVLGFRAEPKKRRPREILTRALLSAGYLGKVHLLQPHAAELFGVIRRQNKEERSSYWGAVERYLKENGVDQDFRLLLDALRKGRTPEEKTENFVKVLREVGADTFIALQHTYGAWQQRLRLLNQRVLRFSDFGPDVRPLLNTSEVWRIYQLISDHRREANLTVNDLTDALAVVALNKMIEASKQSAELPYIRFNTNTKALHEIAREDAHIRSILSYDIPDHWKLERNWHAGIVLRTAEYFILRASFEALRIPDPDLKLVNENEPPPVSLPELERVLRELTYALKTHQAGDARVQQRLEQVTIGGRKLAEVITDLQQASFLKRIITRYRPTEAMRALATDAEDVFDFMFKPPPPLANLVADAGEVYDFMYTEGPRQHLRREIEQDAESLERELPARVMDFHDRMQFIHDIRTRITRLAGKFGSRRSEFIVTDPVRDLGLIRWGGDVTEADLRYAARMIGLLFSADETESMRAASDLTRAVTTRLTESHCLAICAVLWVLSLFERVILTINYYDRNLRPGEIEASLAIMRTAARARVGPPFSTPEKTNHMANLETEISKVQDPWKRSRLPIGLAYAAYYISIADNEPLTRASKNETDDEATARAPWAVRCYRYGEKAIGLLEEVGDRRGLAFAINHCAYVGTVMELFPEQTAEYIRRLTQLEHEQVVEDGREISLWHYRFADTIAVTQYRAAYAKWEQSLVETEPSTVASLRRATCSHITTARELLSSAPPKFGDPEIPEHIEQIERLHEQAGCEKTAGASTSAIRA